MKSVVEARPREETRSTLTTEVPERHQPELVWQPGDRVAYCGVINEEADLERVGVVRGGPTDAGDYLVEWTLPGGLEVAWHTPGELAMGDH